MIPLGLKLSNIRGISWVKWSNLKNGVMPFPSPRCLCYWKGSLLVANLTYFYLHVAFNWNINDLEDVGSIQSHVIPKTFKMVLDTSFPNTRQYKVHIKGKVEQSRERTSSPPTPWCSSYWKGSLLLANCTFITYMLQLTEI